MKYASAHFQTALSFVQAYDGSQPLAAHLKQQFAANKKYGSKDRRNIAGLCYAFFRGGQTFQHLPLAEAFLQALALQPPVKEQWAALFPPHFEALEWGNTDYFPLVDQLSAGIDEDEWVASHLLQPKVYLRLRPGKGPKVKAALHAAGLAFEEEGGAALSIDPGADLAQLVVLNRDVVVQDYSSQQVGQFLATLRPLLPQRPLVWDACAASGGKSILAADTLDQPRLTVSDIRPSILHNLHERLAAAGIAIENSFVADLAAKPSHLRDQHLVMADVPCSGSGTWSRTPEQLYFFTAEKLQHYVDLQAKILQNLLPAVPVGGYLLYLTCSVFHAENEDQVQVLLSSGKFELIEQRLLTGYHRRADTLFGALLRKKMA